MWKKKKTLKKTSCVFVSQNKKNAVNVELRRAVLSNAASAPSFFRYTALEDAEKHRFASVHSLPEVEAAVGSDEMGVGSLVVEVAYANRESWGVVARYLRSAGTALHSPTWLPTGRLRATFLTPQSSLFGADGLRTNSQSPRGSLYVWLLSSGAKVSRSVVYLFISFVGRRLHGSNEASERRWWISAGECLRSACLPARKSVFFWVLFSSHRYVLSDM